MFCHEDGKFRQILGAVSLQLISQVPLKNSEALNAAWKTTIHKLHIKFHHEVR
jgi:hypothetical protein